MKWENEYGYPTFCGYLFKRHRWLESPASGDILAHARKRGIMPFLRRYWLIRTGKAGIAE